MFKKSDGFDHGRGGKSVARHVYTANTASSLPGLMASLSPDL
jgi:hypothetical protein